ncbi:glucosaminidase domain-containing protein [Clostridium bowmanii]|uniref:N-acetylglucosaminidase n=1 Tax=Clostridium bowmanii TaxID=132925 RepID=UPI001C0D4A58|nr:glucosaminidase domain-containing protein [Clostridium bowmanii]MBU3189109.1 glucosaminidase domain-containing protein [Clostridium bowmanii]MCA1073791.1 glucosaminidase domain-containing protein [Clostridium bowmanii]
MKNKIILNKLNLCLGIMCCLFIFIPNTVIAATNPTQWEQKTVNVNSDKVWKIKFNQDINVDNLDKGVKVYNPVGISADVKISYDSINNTIIVQPPVVGYLPGQTYSLQISDTIRSLNSNQLKAPIIKSFTIAVPDNGQLKDEGNKKYVYKSYDITLDEMVGVQSKQAPINSISNYPALIPSDIDIRNYLNPKNYEYHDYAVYQFLTLNYVEGITAEELDSTLTGQGILEGQGKTILDACKQYDVNPAYIIAHAILESGHGKSQLATGYPVCIVAGKAVPSKITYNMFGIGAWDINPLKLGSEKAYNEKWFTPEAAIAGGIKWISTGYINNTIYKQNTLYKMKWNPTTPSHQYATDIAWAYKQSYSIKAILDKYTNAKLTFEMPEYK